MRDVTGPVGIYMRWWGAAKHDVAERIHRPAMAMAVVIAPIDGAGPGELPLLNPVEDLGDAPPSERVAAGEQDVERGAQAIDVAGRTE